MTRPTRLRLFDILNAIRVCERATADRSLEQFAHDDFVFLATQRALEIISEASRHIGEEDKAAYPEVPWWQIEDFGNVLRHGYDQLVVEGIHGAATASISALKPTIVALYQKHKRPSDPWPDAADGRDDA